MRSDVMATSLIIIVEVLSKELQFVLGRFLEVEGLEVLFQVTLMWFYELTCVIVRF